MDPISTGLAGIALVQKSVELIKSNINTVNDIRDIAGALDGLFEGEKQVQKKRFNDKSIIGQSKRCGSFGHRCQISSRAARRNFYNDRQQVRLRNVAGYHCGA
jgi:hypothetical protein